MFTKLLKYEWRATRELLGILCLVCLGASVLGGLTMRYLMLFDGGDTSGNFLTVISIFGMMAAMFAVGMVAVASLLLFLGRFYKSRFTDEGYLTFTLPVTTHQNLLSSLVNTAIGMLLMVLVMGACLLLWLVIGLSGSQDLIRLMWQEMPRLWSAFLEIWGQIPWNYVAMLGLNMVTSAGCTLVMLMLSVTIGSVLAKKHKVLAAVGVFYGIRVLLSMVLGLSVLTPILTSQDEQLIMLRIIRGTPLLTTLVAVAGYFLMYRLVDKRLNLN